jgi:hypothetical protein
MADLTPEEIEELKARDDRFRAVDLAIQLQAELSAGKGLRLFLDALEQDAMTAMEAFADLAITDTQQIALLQVRVRTYVMAQRTFGEVLLKGRLAEINLRNEDLEES